MPAVSSCPQREVFEQFMHGKLGVQEVRSLEEHLDQCEACRGVLQQAAADHPFVPSSDDPSSAQVERVLSRFCTRAAPSAALDATRDDLPASALASALEATAADLRPSTATSSPGPFDTGFEVTADSIPAVKASAADERTELSGKSLSAKPKATDDDLSFLSPSDVPGELGKMGRYGVLNVLGKGGMGMVLEARDPSLGRRVALKVMLREIAKDESAKQRFLHEARSTAAIKNDHVITIYDVGEDNGVPYFAMEFLSGEPLDQWLKGGRLPPPAEVIRIGKEIARGLGAAHELGLIHRDIKPGNIWLEAPNYRVKILDFGLARSLNEDLHLTKTGLIVGTPAYMAPEQAGGEELDHRCDLFSLGCVLYRLCAGELPFTGASTIAILKALALHEPRPIREINPAIPQGLADVITRLLAKRPSDRPPKAQMVVDMLEMLERNLNMFAGPASRTGMLPLSPVAAAPVDPHQTEQLTRERVAPLMPQNPMPPAPLKRPVTAPSSGRYRESRSSLSKGTIALALLLLAAAGAGGYFLFQTISTSSGALEVISEDPKAKVELYKIGESTMDRSVEPGSHPAVPAGEYEVRLAKGSKGLKLDRNKISIRHDVPEKLRIQRGYAVDPDWVKQVSALPAAEQVERVRTRLKENNSGFDGKLEPKIENNAVVELSLHTDRVQDISPLRAFEKLTQLGFQSTSGQLEDISALQGLPLEILDCGNNRIKDISALQGMPLKVLILWNNPVKDFAPLKDSPLETLQASQLDQAADPLVLQSIKTLKSVNGKPAEEVLKEMAAKKKEAEGKKG
jgi:serine/threonine protein kinase